jgi:hypothetical protein
MQKSRFAILASIVCAAILAVPRAIVDTVERGVAFLVSLMPSLAEQDPFGFDGPALAFDAPAPVALEPALLNSLRHEAGMRSLRHG